MKLEELIEAYKNLSKKEKDQFLKTFDLQIKQETKNCLCYVWDKHLKLWQPITEISSNRILARKPEIKIIDKSVEHLGRNYFLLNVENKKFGNLPYLGYIN